jgi:hypothetical protein
MKRTRILTAALLVLAAAGPLRAQSLFATRGLGVPLSPQDARVSALGGIGVGLLGYHSSLVNPADLAGLARRGATAAFQPVTTDVSVDGAEDGTSGTRFPLMAVSYPLTDRLVTALAFGGYLDQTWGVTEESRITVGDQVVDATDLISSAGGIGQVRLNTGYLLTPSFAVGVGVGLLTGSVERRVQRTFTDSLASLASFDQRLNWRFMAPIASLGARWDLSEDLRVGASVMAGGKLEARGDTASAVDRDYGAPLEVSGGVSARLSSDLLVTGGAVWAKMPSTEGVTVSHETMRVGGGVEFEGVRRGLRTFPIRLGARWAQLPYSATGEEAPTEWGIGGGMGFRLGDPANPAAVFDFAAERGARSGLAGTTLTEGVSEKLWRFTVSLSLFAN